MSGRVVIGVNFTRAGASRPIRSHEVKAKHYAAGREGEKKKRNFLPTLQSRLAETKSALQAARRLGHLS